MVECDIASCSEEASGQVIGVEDSLWLCPHHHDDFSLIIPVNSHIGPDELSDYSNLYSMIYSEEEI